MKGFERRDLDFSLCGLNCALCPMKLDGFCPGCGGGAGNQSCAIAKCSLSRGGMEYCCECGDYPCGLYEGIDEFDSFITHQHQRKDMRSLQALGPECHQARLAQKREILLHLLSHYNDGRRKSLFCAAASLLEVEDLDRLVARLDAETAHGNPPIKEKAALAAGLLQALAQERGLCFKLRKKPAKA